MVYFVYGWEYLGFKVGRVGYIFGIRFGIIFVDSFRFLGVGFIFGRGKGIFVKLVVDEVV